MTEQFFSIDIPEEDALNIFEILEPDRIGGPATVHLNHEVKEWCSENLQDKMVYPYMRNSGLIRLKGFYTTTYGFQARYEKDVILFKLRWLG